VGASTSAAGSIKPDIVMRAAGATLAEREAQLSCHHRLSPASSGIVKKERPSCMIDSTFRSRTHRHRAGGGLFQACLPVGSPRSHDHHWRPCWRWSAVALGTGRRGCCGRPLGITIVGADGSQLLTCTPTASICNLDRFRSGVPGGTVPPRSRPAASPGASRAWREWRLGVLTN